MFFKASNFNQNISSWNVAKVTNMNSMFDKASHFNQNLSKWYVPISNIQSPYGLSNMFLNSAMAGKSDFQPLFQFASKSDPIKQSDIVKALSGYRTSDVISKYGYINYWNFESSVSDMSYLFKDKIIFNEDISKWNVQNVVYMVDMFYNAQAFNQDIGKWDTSLVKSMWGMFSGAIHFNQNIGSWNTSKVSHMEGMFYQATVFNRDIGKWNTSQVNYMGGMFEKASHFNQNLSDWYVPIVTDISDTSSQSNMFSGSIMAGKSDLQPLFQYAAGSDHINQSDIVYAFQSYKTHKIKKKYGYINDWIFGQGTDGVTDLSNPTVTQNLTTLSSFNEDISKWDTSYVKDMNSMFEQATVFNIDIGSWNTSQVTDMRGMFSGVIYFNQNIGSWNTSQVTDMNRMFNRATVFNRDIGYWNTSLVTDMRGMFYEAKSFNQNIGGWNVDKVTNMVSMFEQATVFNRDIGSWSTSDVVYMVDMFYNAQAFNQNLNGWDVNNVYDINNNTRSSMFSDSGMENFSDYWPNFTDHSTTFT
jgi:surface protein